MSALDSARLTADLRVAFPAGNIDVSKLRAVLGVYFWQWFIDHQRDTIIKRKFLFFSVTLKVRDLFPIFVALFGNNPLPRPGE